MPEGLYCMSQDGHGQRNQMSCYRRVYFRSLTYVKSLAKRWQDTVTSKDMGRRPGQWRIGGLVDGIQKE